MFRLRVEVHEDAHLAEQLLRGGIAPRHVRRALRELRDHREDLIAQLEQQGLPPDAAACEAQQRLGQRDALTAQMLAQPELRSRVHRFAWLLFGIAPLFATLVLSVATYFVVIVFGGYFALPEHVQLQQEHGALPVASAFMHWIAPLFIAVPLGMLALRRRMSPVWPVVGVVVIAVASGALAVRPNWILIGPPIDALRTLALACGLLLAYAAARARLQRWAP
jgi:hypothetical protein